MDNEDQDGHASESSSQSASYESNKISRRTALKRLGVVVGGISLAGFGFFNADPQARATLEQMDDPTPQIEEHSSVDTSATWMYSSSWCSSCTTEPAGSSYSVESGVWIKTSSLSSWSSWVYWWS